MAVLQIRVDDSLKRNADILFSGLGLDTGTAVRMFLTKSIESNGIPFSVQHNEPTEELLRALKDSREGKLYGPYNTAKEALSAMLED